MTLKVAHLNVVRGFPGLVKQLEYEETAAIYLEDVQWEVHLYVEEGGEHRLAKAVPRIWKGVFGRKLFAWIWLLRNSRRYDYILVRHMAFDPFSLILSGFVRNRVLVFHAKSEKELQLIRKGWKGWAASKMERIAGRVATRSASAILGVTSDIEEYEKRKKGLGEDFPSGIYPNGILVDSVPEVEDLRMNEVLQIGFMCGAFAEWHGLDLIMDALFEEEREKRIDVTIMLHLIGNVNDEQMEVIRRFQNVSSDNQVFLHGRMREAEYRGIFAQCHVGLGSLAMERNNLQEGATLKVREMLAMGLPVYSGHRDTAIPTEFPYYRIHQCDLLKELVDFSLENRDVGRTTVREKARPFIDKAARMKSVVEFLSGLPAN